MMRGQRDSASPTQLGSSPSPPGARGDSIGGLPCGQDSKIVLHFDATHSSMGRWCGGIRSGKVVRCSKRGA